MPRPAWCTRSAGCTRRIRAGPPRVGHSPTGSPRSSDCWTMFSLVSGQLAHLSAPRGGMIPHSRRFGKALRAHADGRIGWGRPDQRRRFIVETSTIIWIIVAVIVVIAIIVVAVVMTRGRRRAAQVEAGRNKAAELRQNAYESDIARREREADAARATAAAKQAEADALQAQRESERLARESADRESEAQRLRDETDQRLRKADAVDPDVRDANTRRDAADRTDGYDRTDRRDATDGGDRRTAGDQADDITDGGATPDATSEVATSLSTGRGGTVARQPRRDDRLEGGVVDRAVGEHQPLQVRRVVGAGGASPSALPDELEPEPLEHPHRRRVRRRARGRSPACRARAASSVRVTAPPLRSRTRAPTPRARTGNRGSTRRTAVSPRPRNRGTCPPGARRPASRSTTAQWPKPDGAPALDRALDRPRRLPPIGVPPARAGAPTCGDRRRRGSSRRRGRG